MNPIDSSAVELRDRDVPAPTSISQATSASSADDDKPTDEETGPLLKRMSKASSVAFAHLAPMDVPHKVTGKCAYCFCPLVFLCMVGMFVGFFVYTLDQCAMQTATFDSSFGTEGNVREIFEKEGYYYCFGAVLDPIPPADNGTCSTASAVLPNNQSWVLCDYDIEWAPYECGFIEGFDDEVKKDDSCGHCYEQTSNAATIVVYYMKCETESSSLVIAANYSLLMGTTIAMLYVAYLMCVNRCAAEHRDKTWRELFIAVMHNDQEALGTTAGAGASAGKA